MINEIVDSIAISLFQEFGEEYSIYTDTVNKAYRSLAFLLQTLQRIQTTI